MRNPLFPERADNSYRGHRLAIWLFMLLVLMKTAIAVNSIFNGYLVASSADGIPLDSFTPSGAQAVVSLFAILGLAHLMFCALSVVVIIRYRSLIALMYAVFLVEFLCRKLVLFFLPIAKTGEGPGSIVNLVLLAIMIVGLALALHSRGVPQARGGT